MLIAFVDAATITVVKDGGFFGHPQPDMGNVGLRPIKDPTGQTRYVDGYLGQADSGPRKRASTHLGQMRGKVNSCRTREEFDALFCRGTDMRQNSILILGVSLDTIELEEVSC